MPNIFKRFMKPAAVNYVFTDANELTDDEQIKQLSNEIIEEL